MARLTDAEKAAFKEFARGERQPSLPPPVVPFEVYLRQLQAMARLPHPPRPVGMKGTQWKL